jgi:hypothetical protein
MASLTARASGSKQRLTIADRGTFKAAANECGNANDKRAGTVDGGSRDRAPKPAAPSPARGWR